MIYDETLDSQQAGQIRGDTIFTEVVSAMPEGSTLTCFMDCFYSGSSILDLHYMFKVD